MRTDKKPAFSFFQVNAEKLLVPYSDSGLHATFSGLFSDVAIEWIDLQPLLMTRPSSTFFCRVNGDSMKDERLQDGDIVIASITSCTNTSNPSVMIGAGLLNISRLVILFLDLFQIILNI